MGVRLSLYHPIARELQENVYPNWIEVEGVLLFQNDRWQYRPPGFQVGLEHFFFIALQTLALFGFCNGHD